MSQVVPSNWNGRINPGQAKPEACRQPRNAIIQTTMCVYIYIYIYIYA